MSSEGDVTQPTTHRTRSDHADSGASVQFAERQVIESDPLAGIQAALEEGRAAEVLPALEAELDKLQLTTAATWAVLARAYEQLGRSTHRDDANARALSLVDQTHARPDAAEAVALSGLLEESKRNEDALRMLRSAAEELPRDPVAAHALAERLRDCGDVSAAARLLSGMAHVDSTDAAVGLLREAVDLEGENPELQTELGAAMLVAGDVQGALEVLGKAALRTPSPHAAHGWLAEAERRAGNVEGALRRAESILGVNADDPVALRVGAACNRALGRLDLAIEQAARLVSLDPDDLAARRTHIDLLLEADRQDDALLETRTMVELRPDHPMPHAQLGNILARRSDFVAAITAFDSALALDPDNWGVRLARADVLRLQGRLDEARGEVERLLLEKPDDAVALGTRGQIYIAEGSLEEGIELLDRALAISGSLTWALADKAVAESRVGRVQDALNSLSRLTKAYPEDLRARVFKGGVLLSLGEVDGALEEADAVVSQTPSDGGANILRARALLTLDRVAEAIDSLTTAIEALSGAGRQTRLEEAQLRADLRQAHLLRAGALALLDRWPKAAEDYDSALAIDGEDEESLLGRGRCHYMLNEWQEAAQRFEAAIESAKARANPFVEAESLALLGEIERVGGDLEASLAKLERALELTPKAAFALATKGQVLAALGRAAEAKQALTEAIETDATLLWAHEALVEQLRLEGDYEAALRQLERLAPDDGEMSGWQRGTRGQIFAGLGDATRALEELRLAWRLEPVVWIASELANQLALLGGHESLSEALDVVDEAISRFPDEKLLLSSKAEILRVCSRPMEALPLIDQVLSSNPDDSRARGTRAHLLVDTGSNQAALQEATDLIASNPEDSFARTAVCRALINLDLVTEALEQAEHTLEYDPSESTAQDLRFSALAYLGRWQACIAACEEVLVQDAARTSANLTAGYAMRRIEDGRIEQAVAHLRRAVIAEPGDIAARVELADGLGDAGQDDEARRLRTDVTAELKQSRRNDAYDLAAAGWAALWLGEVEQSVEWLADAILLEPERLSFQCAYATALVAAARDELAIDELEGAVSRVASLSDRERARAILREGARDLEKGPIVALRGLRDKVVEQARGIISAALRDLESGAG